MTVDITFRLTEREFEALTRTQGLDNGGVRKSQALLTAEAKLFNAVGNALSIRKITKEGPFE